MPRSRYLGCQLLDVLPERLWELLDIGNRDSPFLIVVVRQISAVNAEPRLGRLKRQGLLLEPLLSQEATGFREDAMQMPRIARKSDKG